MHRVYFDGNDVGEHGYLLMFDRSLSDLAKIPGGPKEGMIVTIYMIGEIEMEATLQWDDYWKCWAGEPAEGTVRDNNEPWD